MAAPQILGASVLMLEYYKGEPAMILFRDRLTGIYSEAGGSLDPRETPEECAQRELKEESLGLFRINISKALKSRHVRTVYTFGKKHIGYCMWVVGPKGLGIRRTYYKFNRSLLKKQPDVPDAWRETDRMTRVLIRDLPAVILGGHYKPGTQVTVDDVYQRRCTIHHRTLSILRKAWDPVLYQKLHLHAGFDGACSHGLGNPNTPLRSRTNNGRAKCYFF